jgi:hypothetical protein
MTQLASRKDISLLQTPRARGFAPARPAFGKDARSIAQDVVKQAEPA